jgi:uncharacterized membrane protein YkvA (DUF1232 family)
MELALPLVRQLPNFLRLLYRLLRDPRVSRVDKALFLAVVAYVITPADLVPDILGPLGRIDDLYLLGLALDRLVSRAGLGVLREHWAGSPASLALLLDGLDTIGSILPRPIRRLLRARIRFRPSG